MGQGEGDNVTAPPAIRLSAALEERLSKYHGYVVQGRCGFWRYRITGHGLGHYQDSICGLPRRSEQSAVDAMERRVAKMRSRSAAFDARRKVEL